MPNVLSDSDYERFKALNNEIQEIMTRTYVEDPNSSEAITIATAKQNVGRGVDMFLTAVGR